MNVVSMFIKKMHLRIDLVVLCFICVYSSLPLLTQEEGYYYSITRRGVEYFAWVYDDFEAAITCENQKPYSLLKQPTDASLRPKDTLSFNNLSVVNCLPIKSTYVDVFQLLNINASIIQSLICFFDRRAPLPAGNYTEGLTMPHLDIQQWNKRYVLKITSNFLHPLNKLKSMSVSSIETPPLPETMQLTDLTFSDRSVIKRWGNCRHLKYLYLKSIEDIPIWPPNCTKLEHLSMAYLGPATTLLVEQSMIAAAPSLRKLSITYCQLNSLPIELIGAAKNLVYLNLSHNYIDDKLLQYSLANAVDDPNAKVLVLIKDDVLDMDLDKGLRRYLTFHTYLRCDDPWFWEKLRYAMPHRVKNNFSGTEDIEMGTTDRPAVEIFQNHPNNGNGIDSVQEEV